ncbi:hypothetical protein [Leptolyngbya sp. Heron Island J]|nr:hypothetical protein [Leptolyngbya sp. Heron Island J]
MRNLAIADLGDELIYGFFYLTVAYSSSHREDQQCRNLINGSYRPGRA